MKNRTPEQIFKRRLEIHNDWLNRAMYEFECSCVRFRLIRSKENLELVRLKAGELLRVSDYKPE